jgi:hypothetical protein
MLFKIFISKCLVIEKLVAQLQKIYKKKEVLFPLFLLFFDGF